jgi:hypothetical protein
LLILDSHGSHITIQFIKYYNKNRILLAIFPAHSTHTLQPLDVAIFAPLSKAYTEQLRHFINNYQGFTRLTKQDFLGFFRRVGRPLLQARIYSQHSSIPIYTPSIQISLFKNLPRKSRPSPHQVILELQLFPLRIRDGLGSSYKALLRIYIIKNLYNSRIRCSIFLQRIFCLKTRMQAYKKLL